MIPGRNPNGLYLYLEDVDGLADAGIADTNCAFRGRNCRWVGHAWHHTAERYQLSGAVVTK